MERGVPGDGGSRFSIGGVDLRPARSKKSVNGVKFLSAIFLQ